MRNLNPPETNSFLRNCHANKRFKSMKNNIEVAAIQAKDLRPAVVSHGSVSVIGRRRVMEDTVATEKLEPYYFFGVYDGHGGASVANACRDRLHKLLEKEVVQELACQVRGTVDWERAMTNCFLTMDREVGGAQANSEEYGSTVGSTAVVAMVGTEDIVVANCGDSRAILFSSGLAVPLSRDHKPDRPDERGRVEAAGGRIIEWNGSRVLGVLATSRSIGDHYLKPYVISEPEVTIWKRTGLDSFLIMASDGLWDVVSNEFACKIVSRCLHGQTKRSYSDDLNGSAVEAAALLAELAIARGSKDNVSVTVVELNG